MYQLTEEERKELKQLKSRGLIYIARDSDGGLWAYNYPPERKDITWDLYLDDKKEDVYCPYCGAYQKIPHILKITNLCIYLKDEDE